MSDEPVSHRIVVRPVLFPTIGFLVVPTVVAVTLAVQFARTSTVAMDVLLGSLGAIAFVLWWHIARTIVLDGNSLIIRPSIVQRRIAIPIDRLTKPNFSAGMRSSFPGMRRLFVGFDLMVEGQDWPVASIHTPNYPEQLGDLLVAINQRTGKTLFPRPEPKPKRKR